MVPQLHHTLTAAVEALAPPGASGVILTEAELDLPLEISIGGRPGHPVIGGTAPHTRWVSGFLPPVHIAHLRITLVEEP
jgi:hypothetical protein